MKRKYREAAHAKLRLQDAYIDGVTDDEALDAQQAYDDYEPVYEGDMPDSHLDKMIPF